VTTEARYLYAIGRNLRAEDLRAAQGINQQPLEVVRHRGLDAVVSTVSLDEFGEEPLKANLEQLAWLESVARAHDEVVALVARSGAVAPLRLATICLDDDGVRARLDEWFFPLQQVLDRVQGRLEWSVKTFAPPAADSSTAPDTVPAGGPGAGAAYLQRRREATVRRQQAEGSALAAADEVYRELSTVAVAGRRLPAQDPRLSGHRGTMTLNAAFLVGEGETADFEDAVRGLQARFPEAEIATSGPWPPYSFAMLEQR
jgi:gas vesicle protein GvpL/GvpF